MHGMPVAVPEPWVPSLYRRRPPGCPATCRLAGLAAAGRVRGQPRRPVRVPAAGAARGGRAAGRGRPGAPAACTGSGSGMADIGGPAPDEAGRKKSPISDRRSGDPAAGGAGDHRPGRLAAGAVRRRSTSCWTGSRWTGPRTGGPASRWRWETRCLTWCRTSRRTPPCTRPRTAPGWSSTGRRGCCRPTDHHALPAAEPARPAGTAAGPGPDGAGPGGAGRGHGLLPAPGVHAGHGRASARSCCWAATSATAGTAASRYVRQHGRVPGAQGPDRTRRGRGAGGRAARRRHDCPDPAAVLSIAAGPRRRLWERRRTDPDYLLLRVGTADLPSAVELTDPAAGRAPPAAVLADPRRPGHHPPGRAGRGRASRSGRRAAGGRPLAGGPGRRPAQPRGRADLRAHRRRRAGRLGMGALAAALPPRRADRTAPC